MNSPNENTNDMKTAVVHLLDQSIRDEITVETQRLMDVVPSCVGPADFVVRWVSKNEAETKEFERTCEVVAKERNILVRMPCFDYPSDRELVAYFCI